MGTERNDCLTGKVITLQEGLDSLGHRSGPYRIADKHGVVLRHVFYRAGNGPTVLLMVNVYHFIKVGGIGLRRYNGM